MLNLRIICLLLFVSLPLVSYAQDANEDLLEAAQKGEVAKIRDLLAKGANVNAKSSYGVTPLGFACRQGNVETVKLLLDHGADITVQDSFYKMTPYGMMMLGKKASPELIQLLLERGAKETNQAMNFALNNNHLALTKSVLSKAKFSQDDLDNYLRAAHKKGQKEIAEALKAAGAKEWPEFKIEAEALKTYEGTFKGDNLTVVFTVKEGKLIGTANGDDLVMTPLKLHIFEDARNGRLLTFTLEGDKVTGVTLKFPNRLMNLKKEMAK